MIEPFIHIGPSEPEDWHKWVYGGQRNPLMDITPISDQEWSRIIEKSLKEHKKTPENHFLDP